MRIPGQGPSGSDNTSGANVIVSTAGPDTTTVQAHKLAALGQIAAGIAHELATPVQFVSDNLVFLQGAFDELVTKAGGCEEGLAADIPLALEQALEGTRRAAEIIRAMRSLAHPGRLQPVAADLNEGLRTTLVLARARLMRLAEVTTELGALPHVLCHPGLINQVLLNLLVNAGDAVEAVRTERGPPGRIHITTSFDGRAVEISVRDNGVGIPPEDAAHIFEPFYTTKGSGAGTGQGLAIARRLIEDVHGGSITFRSNEDAGVTFTVRLPVAAPAGKESLP